MQNYNAKSRDCWNYAINELVKMLRRVADHIGDKASSNFQGLPSSINFEPAGTNVAEIKFQTHTDWNFEVTLQGVRLDGVRIMTITGKSGYIDMLVGADDRLCTWIHISGEDEMPNPQPLSNYKEAVDEAMEYLVAYEYEHFGPTNKIVKPF
jgi:hypothetical protein